MSLKLRVAPQVQAEKNQIILKITFAVCSERIPLHRTFDVYERPWSDFRAIQVSGRSGLLKPT